MLAAAIAAHGRQRRRIRPPCDPHRGLAIRTFFCPYAPSRRAALKMPSIRMRPPLREQQLHTACYRDKAPILYLV